MALFPKLVVGANVVAMQSSPRFACSSVTPILGLSSAWFVVLLEAVSGAAFSGVLFNASVSRLAFPNRGRFETVGRATVSAEAPCALHASSRLTVGSWPAAISSARFCRTRRVGIRASC